MSNRDNLTELRSKEIEILNKKHDSLIQEVIELINDARSSRMSMSQFREQYDANVNQRIDILEAKLLLSTRNG